MAECEKTILDDLFLLADEEYKRFNSSLIPNVDKASFIGVRVPDLRKKAKEIFKSGDYEAFISLLPHNYYEENALHGFIIEQFKDFDKVIEELERFLPFVDNWAVCDLMSPKALKKNKSELLTLIKEWIKSKQTYTVRFAIKMLMSFYLDEDFRDEYLQIVSSVKSDEYYINMMIAWFFATALAKQYDFAVKFIEEQKLSKWVHNKTIQKAIESYRITDEQKIYLRTLKIK